MKLKRFSAMNANEKNILKVVEWAHRQKIQIENLTIFQIVEAVKAYLRESSHA